MEVKTIIKETTKEIEKLNDDYNNCEDLTTKIVLLQQIRTQTNLLIKYLKAYLEH